jgi:hypothetical protein
VIVANPKTFESPHGLYWDGQQGYHRYDYFARRAASLDALLPPGPILVVGCGFGYTVDELIKIGRPAYGVDASAWAIQCGRAECPNVASRLYVGDALTTTGFQAIPGVAFVVTDDLVPCLEDAEIAVGAPIWRGLGPVTHVITTTDHMSTEGRERSDARLNWKTMAEWAAMLSEDSLYDAASESGWTGG